MSIKYGQVCPIAKAAELLGERWTILIIRELLLGTSRFSDFQRALSQISPSLLTKRLGQLVDAELVVRKPVAGTQRSEYHLTKAGRELESIVVDLGTWGSRWARGQMSDDELDVEMLMFDFSRRIDEQELPSGRTVLHFTLGALPRFANWWILLEDGKRELCLDAPSTDPDLIVDTNPRTLAELWAGDTSIQGALASGALTLRGSPVLSKTISRWLRLGMFADVRPAK